MTIYLGTDHRGYKLKENIFQWLVDGGHLVEDYGAYELNPDDDYTLHAEKVASVVAREKEAFGILLCGSGVGMAVAANKFDNIRASVGKEVDQVKAGRCDDDLNILVIAADFTSETEAKEMIETFLQTRFDGEVRHVRRLEDIKRIEANN
ncbi:RpiB/LacA/LacB family sugar-phosphate isomerase [Candidatus Woesebacteria bacterium]|nr:MAG: RpiB/LacA/LacB family sugar-phosphate isomerase [Candidatus Woesebacteria bacterium]